MTAEYLFLMMDCKNDFGLVRQIKAFVDWVDFIDWLSALSSSVVPFSGIPPAVGGDDG